jgi:hypothetical protein
VVTPAAVPHGTGPQIVGPEIRTCAPWPTRTIVVQGHQLRVLTV